MPAQAIIRERGYIRQVTRENGSSIAYQVYISGARGARGVPLSGIAHRSRQAAQAEWDRAAGY